MKRESGFELLRIVCLFLVILTHVIPKWWWNIGWVHYNWHISIFLGSLGRVAVGSFIMLSGYFMYRQELHFKKRYKSLLLPLVFYLIVFIAIILYNSFDKSVNEITMSVLRFIQSVLNDSSEYGHLWYVYTLFIFMLFAPFVNIIIKQLSDKQLKVFIGCLALVFVLFPTMNYFMEFPLVRTEYAGNGASRLGIFTLFYVMGASVHRLKVDVTIGKSLTSYLGISVLIYLLTYFFSLYSPGLDVMKWIGINITYPSQGFTHNMFYYDNILVVVSTFSFFLIFTKIKIRSKVINYLGSLTYGGYLVHFVFTIFLFKLNAMDNVPFWYSPLLIPVSLFSALFILCLSLLTEITRKMSFKVLKKIYNISFKESSNQKR